MTSSPYRFYAAEVSYFSGKVRPALRYKGVHYLELRPDMRLILARTGLTFIPVLLTPDDEAVQDTSEILDALEERVPSPPLYPKTPVQSIVSRIFELYADEFMILPAMHYRWSFPESERKARGDFSANIGSLEAGNRFADRMKGALPFLGIDGRTASVIESHLEALLDELSAHFAEQPFLLGARMSLADCALMGPFYGHLYLDAVPSVLLRERAPLVCNWIERMNRPDPDAPGEWLADDALAPTLRPLLERIGRDSGVILDGIAAFEAWADSRPSDVEEPPRVVGAHRTSLDGTAFERGTSSYSLWMLQRVLDPYRALAGPDRAAVDRVLDGTGCNRILAYEPRHRLEKRKFKLALTAS